MSRGLLNLFRGSSYRGGSAGLRHSQRRTYLTKEKFESEVPKDVQDALKETPPKMQKQGEGTCAYEAEKNRKSMQKHLDPNPSLEVDVSDTWSKKNAEEVMKGRPATVKGYGLGTKESEWPEDHAVTVVSPTNSSKGQPITKDTSFVVLDSDTTHHKQTLEAAQKGVLKPSDSTRIMTHDELSQASPKVVTFESGMSAKMPMVHQATEPKPQPPTQPNQGLFSWLFGGSK